MLVERTKEGSCDIEKACDCFELSIDLFKILLKSTGFCYFLNMLSEEGLLCMQFDYLIIRYRLFYFVVNH